MPASDGNGRPTRAIFFVGVIGTGVLVRAGTMMVPKFARGK